MSTVLKFLLCSAIILQGCSGGGDDNAEKLRGVFLDSPVSGLRYATPTYQGFTDDEGVFFYAAGETITFSIGELAFPSIAAVPTITPLELAGVDDIEDEQAVNLLRLLQTVDVDQNPDNGITIPASAHDTVTIPEIRFNGSLDVEQFLGDIVAQVHDDGRNLVQKDEAVQHLVDTLSDEVSSGEFVQGAAALIYLVEVGQQYSGAFLSLQGADYSLNLDGSWHRGTIKKNQNVLRLKANGGGSNFLTSGLDENNDVVYCFGKRPYSVSDCDSNARLFAAFNDESEARRYNTIQEPVIGAVEEEIQQPESNIDQDANGLQSQAAHSGNESDLVEEGVGGLTNEFDQEGQAETAQSIVEETDSNEANQTDADPSDNENTSTDLVIVTETDESTNGVANSNSVTDQLENIVTTTNCPSGLRAPARFSVYADEPVGCQWEPFENPAWTWNSSAAYNLSDNSITASEGGVYSGEFAHRCIDSSTGQQRTVTASCVVDIANSFSVDDITDLVFVTGQTNASGLQTEYDAVLDAPDNRVFAYTDLGWQKADLQQYWEHSIPGNFSADDPSRSPYNSIAFQLSRAIADQSGRVVGLVVLTAPGEGISHWDYNSDFSIQIRDKATAALNALPNKSSFDAMIWLQGETDWLLEGTADPGATGFSDTSGDEYKNYYPNKLFQLINNLRSESWFKFDGRFICAETKKAALNPHLLALNNDTDPLSGCAVAADLETRSSDAYGNHFSAESLRTLGKRLADIYLSMD